MECYCDYEPSDFYSASRPVARKVHRCEECGGPVLPGEQYERAFSVTYGHADTFKTCVRCVDLRTWVKNNVPCLCWAHGNLNEDLREAVNEARWRAPEETAGLWFGFMRRVVARRKHNELHRRAA